MDYHGTGKISSDSFVTFCLGLAQPYGRADYEAYLERVGLMRDGEFDRSEFIRIYYKAGG